MCNDKEEDRLNKMLMPWIGRSAKLFGCLLNDVFKENAIDLSREQLIILKMVNTSNGMIQNDLAFITDKDKTTLTRLINKLEKKELIERKQSEEDMRCNKVFITTKGKAVFEDSFPLLLDKALEVQKIFSKEEIETTLKVVQKLTHHLKEINHEKK